jgi:hypothetical protein
MSHPANVPILPKIYNISEAFEFLSARGAPLKNEKSIYLLTHRKEIGHFHMGRELRFAEQDLEDYLIEIRGEHILPRKLIDHRESD